jgi:uncharacterized protein YkwD
MGARAFDDYKDTVHSVSFSLRGARSRASAAVATLALVVLPSGVACQPRQPGSANIAEAGPIPRPPGPLTLEQATDYVLRLVNHDRAGAGLSPVEWDETAAHAARAHVEDMAEHGYTAHWGTDGSVPEERYTRAGGVHMVLENAECFFDEQTRPLDPSPTFMPVDLEKMENAFMSETPPHDGHRQNILKPRHNKLGVGLAKPMGTAQPCLDQEFIDDYGTYDALPKTAHVGEVVHVSGEVHDPLRVGGVGIARIEPAKPRTAADLGKTSTYLVPPPYVLYLPPGFVTPKPVEVNGNHFRIDVPLSDARRPGRYEVTVWAMYPGDKDLAMVGIRVINVE